ncbi:putative sulfate exporter family transporter [Sphingobacterium sp. UT-1RO-CII-1]|uniref:YeiH family protein n=1 Tax=Sphingobacterium sp. UT-1RO-CII-1 TaxID=2995225 RepID=UPI00227A69D2|nr:putative sulfate exporter family transporter [Sphingobacterium sp. UT-1RO-CII-1]MCY4778647.1 putative sulfate exporter family transporter [Sphingobacterium sp. UT-1RO-CII-1]
MNTPKTSNFKLQITEDWTVVILGFILIGLAVSGFPITIPTYTWEGLNDFSRILSINNLSNIIQQFLLVYTIVIFGNILMGKPIIHAAKSFPIVFILTVCALFISGNTFLKDIGLEAVIFSLLLGLILGNFFKLPAWLRNSLQAEVFVKIGLVLLGTSVIFSDIVQAGTLGLVQSLIVVLSVWYFAFWLCKKWKIDEELTMMISSAVSICGVSAAIATSGAIKGDSKKLSYVVSMVLITAIPMMLGMPYLAKAMGLSQEVTGAWLGGSIDTSGAVVASGSLVGDKALEISTIVKFSQNVLLGVAALAISIYWTYRGAPKGSHIEKPSLRIIWERFPKFVLGFIAASVIFSFFLAPEVVSTAKSGIKEIQVVWFALAFTSIGMETNFKDLISNNSLKPFLAFTVAQLFNVIITLFIALWLFGSM